MTKPIPNDTKSANATTDSSSFPFANASTDMRGVSSVPTAPAAPSFASTRVRSKQQIGYTRPQFSRNLRENSSTKDKLQICREATAGAPIKVKKIDYDKVGLNSKDDTLFENNVEVETFISTVERHCIRFDMAYFFKHFPILDDPINGDHSQRFSRGITVDLFEEWDTIGELKPISLQMIAEGTQWLKEYTDLSCESYLEDLEWTDKHLMNSMDIELHDSIASTLKHDFSIEQWGGQLTFAIMIDKCINLSESAIDNLRTSIETYDLKKVPGENVDLVVRRFLYAFKRLKSNNGITPSLIKSLFKVFQTTSVPEYNKLVADWGSEVFRKSLRPSYEEILREMKRFYKELCVTGDWNGVADNKTDDGNAFQAEDKSSRQDTSRPDFSAPTEADKIQSDPPRYARMIKGRQFKYCSKCPRNKLSNRKGRWNTTHFSDEHHGGQPQSKSGESSKPSKESANHASTDEKEKPSVSFEDGLKEASL